CPAIFWMQGENNYVNTSPGYTAGSSSTTDKDEYSTWLLRLKNDMQTDICSRYNQSDKPLFISYQVGAQYIKNLQASISMSQLETSNRHDDMICAGPVYPMTDRGGHLDPNGYRWFGEMMGKVYYKTKIQGEDFKPLQPLELSRTNNPNQLKIKFLVPHLPLVLDEQIVQKQSDYGFEIYAGGSKKTIGSVTIENDCVILTASTSLAGQKIEVVYAGQNTSGHGNLRDSDPYQAFDSYIDLDGKNGDSFIYPRSSGETTLRPSYEPRDNEGIIYGKKYPLYNFSVSFFYALQANETTMTAPSLASDTEETTELSIIHSVSDGLADEITAALNGVSAAGIRFLKVSGATLSYSDCRAIVDQFPNLLGLDLSGADFADHAIPDASAGLGAFENCPVSGLRLPSSTTEIGTQALKNCASLPALTIYAANVKSNAFEGATSLQSVYYTSDNLPATTEITAFPTGINIIDPNGKRSEFTTINQANILDGTSDFTYNITIPDDLDALRLYPSQLNANYMLSNILDLKNWMTNHADKSVRDSGWLPIGNTAQPFSGSFNGNGFVIKNLWIDRPSTNDVGLFGALRGNATTAVSINDLGVVIDPVKSVTGNQQVGGISGAASDNVWIDQCFVSGNIFGTKSVGGFIGANYAKTTIKQCYTNGAVTVNGDGAAGFAGVHYSSTNQLTIDMCYSTSALSAAANGSGAGLVGGVSHSASSPPSDKLLEIKNSFALNPSVVAGTAGRLSGWERTASASVYTNNHAYSDMTLNGNTQTDTNADSKNAADISGINVLKQASYATWDFDDTWQMANGDYQLPVLKRVTLDEQPNTALDYLGRSTGMYLPKIKLFDYVDNQLIIHENTEISIYDVSGRLLQQSTQSVIN
ncbi:MAG: leucine-rich repeat domain-containing protein, partial [Candidatus Symbiothrix sp.]|nr:leucine-rich repeat domain-containing protein [Candidatus Symbiothrix sp.]